MNRPSLGMLAVLAVTAVVACNSKEFNASFCASYKESFVKTCSDVCTKKSGQAEACQTKCTEALPKDATYQSRCANLATGASSSAP